MYTYFSKKLPVETRRGIVSEMRCFLIQEKAVTNIASIIKRKGESPVGDQTGNCLGDARLCDADQ